MIFTLLAAAAVGVPAADKTPAAARAVVERYYRAIDHGQYRTAFTMWSDNGRASGKTLAQFTNGFARTARTHVITGQPTDGEGAAGSLYVTVPVTVTATLKNGARQRFWGSYTLRRVNDVPGATPAQLRWHLATAKLRPA